MTPKPKRSREDSEHKAHRPLPRIDVFHCLMGYVTGQIRGEGNGGFELRLPHNILFPFPLLECDEPTKGTRMLQPKSSAARSGQSLRLASNNPTSSVLVNRPRAPCRGDGNPNGTCLPLYQDKLGVSGQGAGRGALTGAKFHFARC